MKASIALEYVGEAQDAKVAFYSRICDSVSEGLGKVVVGRSNTRKPWVAKLTGLHPTFGFERSFLNANWQRKRANASHSRGVELWFVLESCSIYEVSAFISWAKQDRYFCTVNEQGETVRLTKEEVKAWLKKV